MITSILRNIRPAVLLAAVLVQSFASGQDRFTVHGRMKVEGSDLNEARAVVYKNGVRERAITTGLSKFTLSLELDASYVVSFEKNGFVSKKLSFDTHVPAGAVTNGFTPFDFAVSLFKQYDDINIVVFNQPVGMIRYDGAAGDFDYDTDYTKSVQSQMQDVVTQVEKKQKEEQSSAAGEEKRKAEEAKAQAKAKAEEEKKAAAEQAAQAKAKAEEEKRVAAEQAAQARTRTEAEHKAAAETAAQEKSKQEAERAEKARTEAARKEEEKRKVPERAVVEIPAPKPVAAPPAEKPKPLPMRPSPVHNTLASKPQQGEDGRRSIEPMMSEEASRVAKARTNAAEEPVPLIDVEEAIVNRTEDLQIDAGMVTTIIKLESEGVVAEYRRVYHKWGGTFYFKNGDACTQLVYDRETGQEQLAGATPRPKLD
ncbi:MAG: hypothetical protein IT226_10630 [Flavobacteriales bacterium]|nr:hypothetical protein [Flavobacteriales bacterium]